MNQENSESQEKTVVEEAPETAQEEAEEIQTGLTVELLKKNPTTIEDTQAIRAATFLSPTCWDRLDHFVREVMKEGEPDFEAKHAIGMAILGHYEEAESELEALKSLPSAACLLGRSYLDTGREEKAAELFLEIHKRVPEVLDYHIFYVEALDAMDDLDGFRREVEKLVASHPDHAFTIYFQGRALEREGELEKAEDRYIDALDADPNHAPSLFRLAYRMDLEGRDDEAIDYYQQCMNSGVSNLAALVNLGILYDDDERYGEALTCFDLARMIYPRDKRVRRYYEDAAASLVMFYDEEKEKKEDKQAQILRIPVTDFELSVRSRNCLSKMNIRTLGDLILRTEAELLAFKNFGETSLLEIKSILNSKGLRLGMVTPDVDELPNFLDQPEVEDETDSVLNKPLGELDLSIRSRNCLDFLMIKTLGQLADITEQQLTSCKNFGQTSLNEIRRKLADYGLALKS